ncbi:MAG: hypothetical protein KY445_09360 [Armatimonadetes bacterium]|nr:hypothetical protein [Armatimonadota bacterium]
MAEDTPKRFHGKEVRAPRRPGRPRKEIELPEGIAPKDMTPEQLAAHKAKLVRRSRRRKDAPSPTPRSKAVRVYAPTQEEAEAIAGPHAIAIKHAMIRPSLVMWERVHNTVAGVRKHGVAIDITEFCEIAFKAACEAYEKRYNDGDRFEKAPEDDPDEPIFPRA